LQDPVSLGGGDKDGTLLNAFIVAPVLALVTDSAVVKEPLKVREIPPSAVCTLDPRYVRFLFRRKGWSVKLG